MLFGTELGGEITGTATVTDKEIILSIDVDGHLDNEHSASGMTAGPTFCAVPERNSRSTINVTGLTQDADASDDYRQYHPQDGFNVYAEEY